MRIMLTILMIGILLLSACTIDVKPSQTEHPKPPRLPQISGKGEPPLSQDELNGTQELRKFSSAAELAEFLSRNQPVTGYGYDSGMMRGDVIEASMNMVAGAPMMEKSLGAGAGASEYSETNVQVEGVDEADIVKNDGKYIYTLSGNKLVIIDAYPAENAEIVSETEIKGQPKNLFVNGDRLVVFSQDNENVLVFQEFDIIPRPRYTQETHAYIYDISDRSDPDLVADFTLKGAYFQSRMIGDYVYFITKENVYYYSHFVDMPVLKESGKTIIRPEVYYFDNPEDQYMFHTIASINIQDEDEADAKTYMLGYSNNMYVSKNNIYITYQKNFPMWYTQNYNKERFYDVVLPLLPRDIQKKINDISEDESLNSYEQWDKISSVLQDMYNEMDEDDKEDFIEEMMKAVQEYDLKFEKERRKTVIHKIAIDDGMIEYEAKGEVPGSLLNQFSMDEHGDYFRVATTMSIWTRSGGSETYNNVYIMNKDLDIVGSIEDIAPGERIYSTRFIGDRLYMVTFKRVDPLFVIDLSDPENPEILGKLKIPGYSDYLHPYDENHIIGVGKETGTNQWGGTSIRGVKLALFDVSDVENPEQIDKYEIGEAGTDSEALRDHKAFLFDKEKNLLVIPIREVKGRYYDGERGYYRNRVWQGAYVFEVTENGFRKKGKISHGEEDDQYYWGSPSAVRRSLYMDNVLYTISAKYVKMNDLSDLDEINEVELPYDRNYYPRPVYY